MAIKYLIKLSVRSFIRRPVRTLLTVLAMGVGISAILIFVSLGFGLQKTMLEQITTQEALLSLDVTSPDLEVLPLDNQMLNKISKIENVQEISPLAILPGEITIGKLTSNTNLNVCPRSYLRLGGIFPEYGKIFERENEILVSSALAKAFGFEEKEILKKRAKIKIFLTEKTEKGEETKVKSLENEFLISGVIADDTMVYLYLPFEALKSIEISNFNELKVKVKEGKFLKEVADKLTEMGFLVSSLSETVEEANKVFMAIQITLSAFGIVALIVAAIGMANTMTVTLLERTNEIGIMKAIGASEADIRNTFLFESALIAISGGLTGIFLNFLASGLLNKGFNILAKGLGGQPVTLFYTPPWFLILIIVFSIIVGLISGFFPAKKGAQMDPLEALRYK